MGLVLVDPALLLEARDVDGVDLLIDDAEVARSPARRRATAGAAPGVLERVDRSIAAFAGVETTWQRNSSRSRRSTWAGSSMPLAAIGTIVA
jgi:hypothetical protein